MNATAIYSKSGKGVQEASGKTSHLSRSDRAVLAAIDGRATLAEVAQKIGKPFDAAFEKLIESLDQGGFIREVSAGTGGARVGAAKAEPAKPGSPAMDLSADLDFTTSLSQPPKAKAPLPPAPPPLSAEEKAKAERIAREQQDTFVRAREEAERKAAAERERVKAEAEAKMRAETEARLRAEADAKVKAEAEAKAKAAAAAKVRAAQEAAAKAAAEAKAKAEAEAKKVREEAERARKAAEEKAERARKEAERARKEAEEKAERARKEAEEKAERVRKEAEEKAERARKEVEEKARREQAELLRKLEEERKAREEAERKAKEDAKRLEEERRKHEEERVSRRIQEERERVERRKFQHEEEERAAREEERAARRKPKEDEQPYRKPKEDEQPFPALKLADTVPAPAPAETPPASAGGGFSDTLLADLESFTTRDEAQRQKEETANKEREEAARKEREEAAARSREAEEQRAREEAERQEREHRELRKREEAQRKAMEQAALHEREERERQRLREEEEKRKREAEERARKAKQEEQLAARAERGAGVFVEAAQARSRRERELAVKPRGAAAKTPRRWGRSIALTLLGLLVVAVGVAHVMPIDTSDYQRVATEALGRPVRIGSARLSLFTWPQLKLSDVRIGDDLHIPQARAYPELSSLLGPRKTFSRIEIDSAKLPQAAIGHALFANIKAENFGVGQVSARGLELTGPLVLPKGLEFEAAYDRDGALRTAVVRGPDALLARFSRGGQGFDADISAASLTLPFAPEITLTKFSAKGIATRQGMTISEWDAALLNGSVSGTANLRWGDTWTLDGVVTARNVYAAVFAPALVSDGKAEGSGKFQMRGAPGKLASTARLDGSFTVTRGVLGSIDLTRAIQTGGKFATGRTEFSEMNGQATYDRGAVALRNITLGAGQLNAGASADIAQNGALSGRIVADVRVASQTMRATLFLAGTVKEPQVRN
ncbi:MAG TPA: hypothetical protein VFR66_14205 [Burkholderiales bacterium]|nr:hypothetical protein [Burkholderiales bacterium]